MENNKLVKEIITTTTERYGDGGGVKEKVTEIREKIYSTFFSDEEIEKAKPINDKIGENPPPTSPKPGFKSQEDKIKEAASAIDAQKQQETAKPQNPYENWQQQQQQAATIPQYNVANRAQPPVTKFPWEAQ